MIIDDPEWPDWQNWQEPARWAPPGPDWVDHPPTAPGFYWMACEECDGEPELVFVMLRVGRLDAIDTAVGTLPVAMYHDGLCGCRWQPAHLA